MTNQTDTRTEPIGPPDTPHPHEYLFIEHMTVVGTILADCAVCAWKAGHVKWPNALMALWCGEASITDKCHWKEAAEHRARGESYNPFSPTTLIERLNTRGKAN